MNRILLLVRCIFTIVFVVLIFTLNPGLLGSVFAQTPVPPISEEYVDGLSAANRAIQDHPQVDDSTSPLCPAQNVSWLYPIKAGDTLSVISQKFGIPVDDIVELTNAIHQAFPCLKNVRKIVDPNKIYAGKQVFVPVFEGFDEEVADGAKQILNGITLTNIVYFFPDGSLKVHTSCIYLNPEDVVPDYCTGSSDYAYGPMIAFLHTYVEQTNAGPIYHYWGIESYEGEDDNVLHVLYLAFLPEDVNYVAIAF